MYLTILLCKYLAMIWVFSTMTRIVKIKLQKFEWLNTLTKLKDKHHCKIKTGQNETYLLKISYNIMRFTTVKIATNSDQ